MLTKIYFALWTLIIAAAGVTYFAGMLTEPVVVAFGFLSFGMVFMGMMSVLPTAVHDSIMKH